MEHLLQATIAILAIANPLGAASMFSSMTDALPRNKQRGAALRASVAVFAILGVASMSGSLVLQAFGISLPAFQAGGGLVVLIMGLEMLRGAPTKVQHVEETGEAPDDSILVPFAMPLVAGPGAITTVVTLTSRQPGIEHRLEVLAAASIVSVLLLVTFLAATWLAEHVSRRVHQVFIRFMGLVLVAVGAQLILSGVTRFVP